LLAGQYAFILHYFSKKLLDCSFTAKIERCPAWDASIRRIGVAGDPSNMTLGRFTWTAMGRRSSRIPARRVS
jgi:hypothetical protein